VTDTKTRWLPNLTKENWVIEISEFIAFVEKNKIPKLFGGMSRSYISALTELDKLLSARYKLPLLLENLSRTVDAQRMLMSAVVSKQGQALQTLSQLKAQLPPEGEEGQYADLQSFTSTVQKTLEGAQQAVLDLQRQNEKQEAALRGQAEERARLAEQAILIHV
jgi:signal transduction histidine kinase